ncbi:MULTISPECIES: DUF397 domain-containing protein [Streptomyces]|uniref:DUF397 domain-containing protein n=1 Tax=Streptomyces TaxID=1883 RepID=UPI0005B85100|nr:MULTISPECIES: DUF397 domain-containing protein [Streptomyces]
MTPEVIGPYRKSSYSLQEGNCVEIAPTVIGGRSIRDGKDRSGPHLTFTGDAWQAFLLDVKSREFDR